MRDLVCTGLSDSNGELIKIKDKLKLNTTANEDVHGGWVVYEVKQKGLTPAVAYLYSEKGCIPSQCEDLLPLCIFYDMKRFSLDEDVSLLKPLDRMVIVKENELVEMMSDSVCTGLSDSNRKLIKIKDKLKMDTTINEDVHGDWVVYEVKQQGLTPVISYLYSEKGQVLPKGGAVSPLCVHYDTKGFAYDEDVSLLQPLDRMVVLKENELVNN